MDEMKIVHPEGLTAGWEIQIGYDRYQPNEEGIITAPVNVAKWAIERGFAVPYVPKARKSAAKPKDN